MICTFTEKVPKIKATQWEGSLTRLISGCIDDPVCFRYWIKYIAANKVVVEENGDMVITHAASGCNITVPIEAYLVYRKDPDKPGEIGFDIYNRDDFEEKYEMMGEI